VKEGEHVLSSDEQGQRSISMVTGLETPIRDNMCTIRFADGETLRLTSEHPVWTSGGGWKSIVPSLTQRENPSIPVLGLTVRDALYKEDSSWQDIASIACRNGRFQTYNLLLQ